MVQLNLDLILPEDFLDFRSLLDIEPKMILVELSLVDHNHHHLISTLNFSIIFKRNSCLFIYSFLTQKQKSIFLQIKWKVQLWLFILNLIQCKLMFNKTSGLIFHTALQLITLKHALSCKCKILPSTFLTN